MGVASEVGPLQRSQSARALRPAYWPSQSPVVPEPRGAALPKGRFVLREETVPSSFTESTTKVGRGVEVKTNQAAPRAGQVAPISGPPFVVHRTQAGQAPATGISSQVASYKRNVWEIGATLQSTPQVRVCRPPSVPATPQKGSWLASEKPQQFQRSAQAPPRPSSSTPFQEPSKPLGDEGARRGGWEKRSQLAARHIKSASLVEKIVADADFKTSSNEKGPAGNRAAAKKPAWWFWSVRRGAGRGGGSNKQQEAFQWEPKQETEPKESTGGHDSRPNAPRRAVPEPWAPDSLAADMDRRADKANARPSEEDPAMRKPEAEGMALLPQVKPLVHSTDSREGRDDESLAGMEEEEVHPGGHGGTYAKAEEEAEKPTRRGPSEEGGNVPQARNTQMLGEEVAKKPAVASDFLAAYPGVTPGSLAKADTNSSKLTRQMTMVVQGVSTDKMWGWHGAWSKRMAEKLPRGIASLDLVIPHAETKAEVREPWVQDGGEGKAVGRQEQEEVQEHGGPSGEIAEDSVGKEKSPHFVAIEEWEKAEAGHLARATHRRSHSASYVLHSPQRASPVSGPSYYADLRWESEHESAFAKAEVTKSETAPPLWRTTGSEALSASPQLKGAQKAAAGAANSTEASGNRGAKSTVEDAAATSEFPQRGSMPVAKVLALSIQEFPTAILDIAEAPAAVPKPQPDPVRLPRTHPSSLEIPVAAQGQLLALATDSADAALAREISGGQDLNKETDSAEYGVALLTHSAPVSPVRRDPKLSDSQQGLYVSQTWQIGHRQTHGPGLVPESAPLSLEEFRGMQARQARDSGPSRASSPRDLSLAIRGEIEEDTLPGAFRRAVSEPKAYVQTFSLDGEDDGRVIEVDALSPTSQPGRYRESASNFSATRPISPPSSTVSPKLLQTAQRLLRRLDSERVPRRPTDLRERQWQMAKLEVQQSLQQAGQMQSGQGTGQAGGPASASGQAGRPGPHSRRASSGEVPYRLSLSDQQRRPARPLPLASQAPVAPTLQQTLLPQGARGTTQAKFGDAVPLWKQNQLLPHLRTYPLSGKDSQEDVERLREIVLQPSEWDKPGQRRVLVRSQTARLADRKVSQDVVATPFRNRAPGTSLSSTAAVARSQNPSLENRRVESDALTEQRTQIRKMFVGQKASIRPESREAAPQKAHTPWKSAGAETEDNKNQKPGSADGSDEPEPPIALVLLGRGGPVQQPKAQSRGIKSALKPSTNAAAGREEDPWMDPSGGQPRGGSSRPEPPQSASYGYGERSHRQAADTEQHQLPLAGRERGAALRSKPPAERPTTTARFYYDDLTPSAQVVSRRWVNSREGPPDSPRRLVRQQTVQQQGAGAASRLTRSVTIHTHAQEQRPKASAAGPALAKGLPGSRSARW